MCFYLFKISIQPHHKTSEAAQSNCKHFRDTVFCSNRKAEALFHKTMGAVLELLKSVGLTLVVCEFYSLPFKNCIQGMKYLETEH